MLNLKKNSRVIIVAALALVAVLSIGCAVNRAENIDLPVADDVLSDTVSPESGIMNTATESLWENDGNGIDVLYEDVDEVIEAYPSCSDNVVSPIVPKKTPLLDVNLVTLNTNGDSRTQISLDVRAAQLTNGWSVVGENGDGFGYESDSNHPLQKQDGYGDVTLSLNNIGLITLLFSDNYPPQSISVQRWNAEYADTDSTDIFDKGEPINVMGDTFQVSDNGNNYIYEIYAKWHEGYSWYVFRIDAANSVPQFTTPQSDIAVSAYPNPYTTIMSSSPGIRIVVSYNEPYTNVQYSAEKGTFITWSGDVVTTLGSDVEVSSDTPVYWKPWISANMEMLDVDTITVTIIQENRTLAETVLHIIHNVDNCYSIG